MSLYPVVTSRYHPALFASKIKSISLTCQTQIKSYERRNFEKVRSVGKGNMSSDKMTVKMVIFYNVHGGLPCRNSACPLLIPKSIHE
jgi:hypothetical protein